MALVTKIKEFREKAGLTQADLAEKVGARRETIVWQWISQEYLTLLSRNYSPSQTEVNRWFRFQAKSKV